MTDLLGKIGGSGTKNHQTRPLQGYNEAFFDLFSLFVGAGRRYSIKEVALATNISADTIGNWSQGISAPTFDNLAILCRVMPFDFKSRFISMLGGADIVAEIRRDYAGILEEVAQKMRAGEL